MPGSARERSSRWQSAARSPSSMAYRPIRCAVAGGRARQAFGDRHLALFRRRSCRRGRARA
jgi:hypothetical protein